MFCIRENLVWKKYEMRIVWVLSLVKTKYSEESNQSVLFTVNWAPDKWKFIDAKGLQNSIIDTTKYMYACSMAIDSKVASAMM